MVLPVASSPENPFKDRAFLNINDYPPQNLKSPNKLGWQPSYHPWYGTRIDEWSMWPTMLFNLGLFEKLMCPLQTADMWQESKLKLA